MNPITLTEAAEQRLNALLQQSDRSMIKLRVTNRGCSGHGYDLSFVDQIETGDERIDLNEGVLLIEGTSLLFLFGCQIDWIEDGLSRSFTFNNPNAAAFCGCGASFSLSK